MRLALIADLHGNFPATEAVNNELIRYNIDKLICLGDIVGKGPESDKTMDWAIKKCDFIIGGNWDFGLGNKRYPDDGFYWNQLGEKRLDILKNLPKEYSCIINNLNIRFIHGRPVMKTLLRGNSDSNDFEKLFFYVDTNTNKIKKYDILAYADTHRQMIRTLDTGHVFNCGSVGNALGVPKACFAIMDIEKTGDYSINLCSINYNRDKAVSIALNTNNMPKRDYYIKEITTGVYSRRIKC